MGFASLYPKGRGFLGGSVVKNLPTNAGDIGDTGLIPGSGRSPGRVHIFICMYIFIFIYLK